MDFPSDSIFFCFLFVLYRAICCCCSWWCIVIVLCCDMSFQMLTWKIAKSKMCPAYCIFAGAYMCSVYTRNYTVALSNIYYLLCYFIAFVLAYMVQAIIVHVKSENLIIFSLFSRLQNWIVSLFIFLLILDTHFIGFLSLQFNSLYNF